MKIFQTFHVLNNYPFRITFNENDVKFSGRLKERILRGLQDNLTDLFSQVPEASKWSSQCKFVSIHYTTTTSIDIEGISPVIPFVGLVVVSHLIFPGSGFKTIDYGGGLFPEDKIRNLSLCLLRIVPQLISKISLNFNAIEHLVASETEDKILEEIETSFKLFDSVRLTPTFTIAGVSSNNNSLAIHSVESIVYTALFEPENITDDEDEK